MNINNDQTVQKFLTLIQNSWSVNIDQFSDFQILKINKEGLVSQKTQSGETVTFLNISMTLNSFPDFNKLIELQRIAKKHNWIIKYLFENVDLSSVNIQKALYTIINKNSHFKNTILAQAVSNQTDLQFDIQNQTWFFNYFDLENSQTYQSLTNMVNNYFNANFLPNLKLIPHFELKVELESIEEQIRKENKENQHHYEAEQEFVEAPKFFKKPKPNQYIKMDIKDIHNSEDISEGDLVSISGFVYKKDVREIADKKLKIYTLGITDFKSGIEATVFYREGREVEVPEVNEFIEAFARVTVNQYSKRASDGTRIKSITLNHFVKIDDTRPVKQDKYETKRVELNTRSKMTTMDGLLEPNEIISIAKNLGHKAVALVDANGVQGFPDFFYSAKKQGVKPIYGVAFDVIDKKHHFLLNYQNQDLKIADQEYVVLDIETTSLSPRHGEIIEFGASIVKDGQIIDKKQFFVKASKPLKPTTKELTKITDQMLIDFGIETSESLDIMYEMLNNRICVAHNAKFDMHYIFQKFIEHNRPLPNTFFVDTLYISRFLFLEQSKHRLENFCDRYKVQYDPTVAHRADYDANVLAQAWIFAIEDLEKRGIVNFLDFEKISEPNVYNKTWSYHINVLAKNQNGLKKLFKLVSKTLTERLFGSPKLFLQDLQDTEDLIIGSGGLQSHLIDALFYSSDIEIEKWVKLVDYVEIPNPNTLTHMIDNNDGMSLDQIYESINHLINLAKKHGKIPVATGDVRYKDSSSEMSFIGLVHSKGKNNSTHFLFNTSKAKNGTLKLPKLEFYTTEEMVDSFKFLNNKELAYEIVVENTNRIADMVDDNIIVIHKDLYTPNFDNSKVKLPELVWKTAKEKYGENLPEIIVERINKELTPIIEHGFDVIYWISHILVKYSLDNGYLVGSRGSVGSSLVATFSGITEINPLPAHYICNNCKYFELSSNPEITSGFDLEDKNCPQCNSLLDKDGQTIPFETFLGFNADKTPDIDLNFSGDFQEIIHKEVQNLFGESHVFRAGTISTLQTKTAFGHIKNAIENYNLDIDNHLVDYLTSTLTGIKATTGQHPGGIIVIPKEYDPEMFTPVNYPSDDNDKNMRTTHLDYNAIHENVLKLDLLGHVDPTAVRMLERLTGLDVRKDIPKKDLKVMSIFRNTDALGITPDDIGGEKTGALGIPEFGTNFVRRMLHESSAESFADLVSLSGLSHGTNVWTGNAGDLIKQQGFKLNQVISCRDDIMVYLISKNVEPLTAFKIMERVRKGKGLEDSQVQIMKAHNVPDWYIDSCQKIQYMFPKAHAAAYVLMAWRIAWFKVYRPIEYYATFFTTRSKEFDLETMINDSSKSKINQRIKEISSNQYATDKEKGILATLEIAREMYARGISISNLSLEKSAVSEWTIDRENNSLIPPFSAVEGLGEAVASQIVEAREQEEFKSKEDFQKRSKVNTTLFGKLEKTFDLFKDLPDDNRFKLF
ncbi:PolC-type DNA polymerase III [Mycoplasma nasistruthionis]|uniref:DNA polymerase III PolC-type n=1 Tax=Mycoplasma nasistruthionis TaxID=353852 RepID=A0A5B7XVV3_9MOLU|nr:PolC-type DNA polymerase III [Mycoplasma nasistruthionis]QCZ36909.1 PolC-type DNA polymerase III [Mycoplasma nasistruthionis]